MKCELCHNRNAEAVLKLEADGEGQELYVCKECLNHERVRRQQKSQRTRKAAGLPPGVSLSITGISSDGAEPPPQIVESIMSAMSEMMSGLGAKIEHGPAVEKPAVKMYDFPCDRAESDFRIGPRLHLEGLQLIGELDACRRAFRALGLELKGVDADGVKDSGHVYGVRYSGSAERARRVVGDLLAQERNARNRLRDEMPRVFGDALCRALAILKNSRLLSPGELHDLLSPLRLAAIENMLDGITLAEIDAMLAGIDLSSKEDQFEPAERDRVDAERADAMNRRFEDVVLNERAEEKFL